jgi:RHS repeat-associated protein
MRQRVLGGSVRGLAVVGGLALVASALPSIAQMEVEAVPAVAEQSTASAERPASPALVPADDRIPGIGLADDVQFEVTEATPPSEDDLSEPARAWLQGELEPSAAAPPQVEFTEYEPVVWPGYVTWGTQRWSIPAANPIITETHWVLVRDADKEIVAQDHGTGRYGGFGLGSSLHGWLNSIEPGVGYYAVVFTYNGEWSTGAVGPVHTALGTASVTEESTRGDCTCVTSTGRTVPFNVLRGDPVNTATGALAESATDAQVAGVGGGFTASRSYNSNNDTVGVLGQGWTFPYGAQVVAESDGSARYVAEDGQEVVFKPAEGGGFRAPKAHTSRLSATADGGFELVTKSKSRLVFDSDGQLVETDDLSDQGADLAYAADGSLESVTDAAGRSFDVSYNTDGFISRIDFPDDEFVSYGYTGDLLTQVTDIRGGITQYSYDAEDRLAGIVDPMGNQIMQSMYDAQGRVVEQTDARGGVTTFEYVDEGDVKRTTIMTDPLGGVTTDTYYDNVLVQTQNAEGEVTTYRYDPRLRLQQTTDPHGLVTTHTYDDDDNLIKTRYANGDEESFDYDAEGNLVSETSPEGHVTAYSYDSVGRVATATDPEGGVTEYAYNDRGQVVAETSPEGHVTAFEYDEAGNRTAVESAAGRRSTSSYDAFGRVITSTSPRGNETGADPAEFTTTSTYDSAGLLTQTTTPGNAVTSYGYDLAGRQTSITDPLERETTREHNAAGDLIEESSPGGAVTTHAYDELGNRISSTDPEGGVTTFAYDLAGRMISKTTPRGNEDGADPADYTWTYVYDGMGNLIEETDPDGGMTSYAHDRRYRQIVVVDPLGDSTVTNYDGDGNVSAEADPMGNTTTYAHDGRGLRTQVTDPAGNTWTTTYDGDGNPVSESAPMGNTTTHTYDGDGLRTSTVTPNGNEDGATADDFTWSYEYDADGNPIAQTDPLGGRTETTIDPAGRAIASTDQIGSATTRSFDAAGQLTSVTGADDAATGYTYTPDGDLETLTDPAGGVVTYQYDAAHRLIAEIDQLDRKDTYGYDAEGNQVEHITARGHESGDIARWTITTDYNALGLPTAITTASAASSKSFTYDTAGQMTSFADASGTTDLTYNANGNITSVARDGEQYTYQYNNRGLVSQATYPGGTQFTYEYDQNGRRHKTQLPSGNRDMYAYDANGNNTKVSYVPPEGTPVAYTYLQEFKYDQADRVSLYGFHRSTGIGGISYVRDQRGTPTAKTRLKYVSGQGWADVPYETYTNDSTGRLTHVCILASDETECGEASGTITYTYDKSGNRTHENRVNIDDPGEIVFNHDDAHQLTSIDGTTLTYDADGNLTDDGTTQYTYDEFNKLAEIDDGTTHTTVAYDALGNRIGMTGGDTQEISWDINNDLPLAAEIDGATYWYDPKGNPIGTDLVYEEVIRQDGLGNPLGVHSRGGSVQWSSSLLPFGELYNTNEETLTTDDVDVAFSGGYNDPTSDNVHLRLRDYNPAQGRFTSVDPVRGQLDQPYVSPYAYANNQPTTLTDPSGACVFTGCPELIGKIYGTIKDDGAPDTWEVRMGIGTGVARGLEGAAYGTLGGHSPGSGLSGLGWNGDYLGGEMDRNAALYGWNSGWYDLTSQFSEYGVYAAGLAGLRCPPGLLGRIGQARPPYLQPPAINAPVASQILVRSPRQLQSKFKHASDFGVTGNYSKANAERFSEAIQRHINARGTRAISGTYRGNAVTHHVDPSTGLNVISRNGEFVSGWRLGSGQLRNVLKHGGLGGG